jgi:hypothetical protein
MRLHSWPWWIVPLYGLLWVAHALTEPIDYPLRATCHRDLWGGDPPYSCTSYWCPKIPAYRLPDWPDCPQMVEPAEPGTRG